MTAVQLRIGNFYMFADYSGIVARAVKEIKHNQFGFLSDFDGVNFEICKPILLTEEWLIRFGFNEIFGKFVINPGSGYNVCVALRNNKWHLYNDDCDAECNIICEVETVHRLQNLFFDIWNFELIIKK